MYLIALTGGIASGKSLVSARLRELGAVIVDADVLAREVVEPGTAGLAAIVDAFGRGILTEDGRLDRPALGAIVFTDPQALQRLNDITHPAVWSRARELFTEAAAANPDAVIVYDVPLLVEGSAGRPMSFDLVVVVEAPERVRVDRMVEHRGMSRPDAEARIRSQATDAERRAAADVVIDNSGSRENTYEQVDALWSSALASATGAQED
ncbi:dephospho-CoA kinase [Leifsonia sp. AK011]|uniref:dephospho-CoA kinase n=1 Tax=Leifsonia sp. AK011 TaxID=2723075 RepID=UPI0015CA8797|nr:dephospho-CoA kinase [Leifsonia sp. AK011]NYF10725.1 dephospho-CoA kinase [Leifsonia sp. AK011]